MWFGSIFCCRFEALHPRRCERLAGVRSSGDTRRAPPAGAAGQHMPIWLAAAPLRPEILYGCCCSTLSHRRVDPGPHVSDSFAQPAASDRHTNKATAGACCVLYPARSDSDPQKRNSQLHDAAAQVPRAAQSGFDFVNQARTAAKPLRSTLSTDAAFFSQKHRRATHQYIYFLKKIVHQYIKKKKKMLLDLCHAL